MLGLALQSELDRANARRDSLLGLSQMVLAQRDLAEDRIDILKATVLRMVVERRAAAERATDQMAVVRQAVVALNDSLPSPGPGGRRHSPPGF